MARALLDRVLNEESRTVRASLANALQKSHSRKLFDLALGVLETSDNPLHRDRAAEAVFFSLRKAWMVDLIQALGRRPKWAAPKAGGNPEIRNILVKISREDHQYDAQAWTAWWEKNQYRFTDED